jgi:hypothetical protein
MGRAGASGPQQWRWEDRTDNGRETLELSRLRKENRELRMVRELLKTRAAPLEESAASAYGIGTEGSARHTPQQAIPRPGARASGGNNAR